MDNYPLLLRWSDRHQIHRRSKGVGCFHPLKFVARAPGIGVDDFLGLPVITNDESHMSTACLGNATLGDDPHLKRPEKWNSDVDFIGDRFIESLAIQ